MNKTLAIRTALLFALLLWPLFLFGRPSYIPDSVSYLKGGQVAVEFALSKVQASPTQGGKITSSRTAVAAASTPPGKEPTKAARSLTYSVTAWLLRWPKLDMTALGIFQALASAFICIIVATAMGVRKPIHFAILSVALAFATPLAVFAANAEPDVFSGIAIACFALFFAVLNRLSLGIRISLAMIVSFAIASHASNPPVALGLMIVVALWGVARRYWGKQFPVQELAWIGAPIVCGMVLVSVTSLIAFGDGSIGAKRFPLALARSVSDGPARWYLEKQCRTPVYAVCEVFGTDIPTTVSGFVFDKTGLNGRATSRQMDRIRAEESEIVVNAALAYPLTEVNNLMSHVLRQLIRFGFNETRFDSHIALDTTGTPQLVSTAQPYLVVLEVLEWASIFLVFPTLIGGIVFYKRFEPEHKLALLLLVPAFIGNAVVVVVFSGVAERYESRMIWLLPLFVLSAFFSISGSRGSAQEGLNDK